MPFDFDAIIIGTGFGATVVAIELTSRMKTSKILMLERGVWWFTPERALPAYITGKPGDKREPLQYWPRPDNRLGLLDLLSVVQTNNETVEALRDIKDRPQPLFRYNSFSQVDILTASGVGGGSLVYSNVSIRPHEENGKYPVMQGWPIELQPDDYKAADKWMADNRAAPGEVVTNFPLPPRDKTKPEQDGYADRDALLAANPGLLLGRSRFLKDASENLDGGWKAKKLENWAPLKLQINEYDPKQPVDPKRFYCERQGRCFMGCLPGARHTLNKTIINKLLTVPNTPLQMQALSEVDHIEPEPGGGYRVFYDNLKVGDDDRDRKKSVTAPVVVLAAGVLGTVELLLKSQKRFKFSPQLGRKFSTNGDFAGFIVNPFSLPYNVYATRGPINTSHVMFKDQDAQGKDIFINVEDAGIPPMLAAPVKRALQVFENAANRDPFIRTLKALWKLTLPDPGLGLGLDPDARIPDRSQTEAEMLQNVFFFNVMGRDRGRGKFSLKGDDLTLDFEGGPLVNDPVFRKIDDLMTAMAQAMKGEYVRFPFWGKGGFVNNEFTGDRKMITVHPLGGCPMGNDASEGAVDKQGRVFTADAAAAQPFYPGLYVADASVIPGPLCVNPTLTIVSFAQKIAAQIPAAMAAAGGGH